ncbi:MAG TPA: ATP phosphoribosyltransferase regulatory subunit [Pyrinomonadaceae bacterium]|nr:ATP phosphoribosyltransferase regulatory subunit [Pyrinomonadaceae bacterium]
MRYHFGAEARLRREVERAALSVFDGWGYDEIATPAVDYYALFERGMGHDEASRAFRFADADGRLLALRPEVTSTVARAAVTLFAERPRPLRLCYAEPVFAQRTRSHAEWTRQGRQVGCELFGAGGAVAELEVLAVAAEVLETLGLRGRYKLTINHAGVFRGLAEQFGLGAGEREELRRLVDLRDAAGLEAFTAAGGDGHGPGAQAARLARLSGGRAALEEARTFVAGGAGVAALSELSRLWDVIERLGLAGPFEFDFGDVARLDYYTGLVFKIFVEGSGTRVGGGGRYDELTINFGRREPAVGFVLDLDALCGVLSRGAAGEAEAGPLSAEELSDAPAAEVLLEARRRRREGARVRLPLEEG